MKNHTTYEKTFTKNHVINPKSPLIKEIITVHEMSQWLHFGFSIIPHNTKLYALYFKTLPKTWANEGIY